MAERSSAAHAAAVSAAVAPIRSRAPTAQARAQPVLSTSLANGASGFTSKTSPLATVLAQYKEAEAVWMQEKASKQPLAPSAVTVDATSSGYGIC